MLKHITGFRQLLLDIYKGGEQQWWRRRRYYFNFF